MADLNDLRMLMERLRGPDGCPWDAKQTWNSLTRHTIEEAYEVAQAAEDGDAEHLKEELGDLLLQVLFYSSIAQQQNLFTLDDVMTGLSEKLIRRHPHVFANAVAKDADSVSVLWDQIKHQEKNQPDQSSLLDDLPINLPGMSLAAKIQKRVSRVGFDWKNTSQVIDKLDEEVSEFKAAYSESDQSAIAEEYGDLLFTMVNLARHLKVDSEQQMRFANKKFVQRFQMLEGMLQQAGIAVENATQQEMDFYWEASKRFEIDNSNSDE
ncbi:nucleoside triphosphate pyrophosphohydrolase [Pelagibaculum spongiae]|uniref:Nucleoside triphosphate pyrophosphohydrolase n=1 Tax=Pelagibaculum spongiae TaxID=2080658 RepID=A0A2V1GR94_9GAMM|nr:nucleoside triphosphate pyrophosphohydrolase [Pelagibaculum spongiae]PVZ64924.1 nucleoside triphosphate pyrophosphohydrolase [Pelagibaculum spongiae]